MDCHSDCRVRRRDRAGARCQPVQRSPDGRESVLHDRRVCHVQRHGIISSRFRIRDASSSVCRTSRIRRLTTTVECCPTLTSILTTPRCSVEARLLEMRLAGRSDIRECRLPSDVLPIVPIGSDDLVRAPLEVSREASAVLWARGRCQGEADTPPVSEDPSQRGRGVTPFRWSPLSAVPHPPFGP